MSTPPGWFVMSAKETVAVSCRDRGALALELDLTVHGPIQLPAGQHRAAGQAKQADCDYNPDAQATGYLVDH